MAADYSTLPKSAAEAKEQNQSKFYTGKPCRNGHVSPRYVTHDMPCVECVIKRKRRWAETNPLSYAASIESRNKKHAYHRDRYIKNRNRIIDRVKLAYWADPEKKRETARRYRRENIETVRAKNREYCSKNSRSLVLKNKIWKANNKDKVAASSRASSRNRQARKIKATPAWANLDLIKLIYAKAVELQHITGEKHHVDHIVPLRGANVCGLHVENNLQILTAADNLHKGRKHGIN